MLQQETIQNSSGETYLAALTQYLDQHYAELASGEVSLKLSPKGVEYVSQRIKHMEALRTLKQEAFMDYVLASVAGRQERNRLDKVAHVLQQLSAVKIQSDFVCQIDQTPLDFTLFENLTRLEIRGCAFNQVIGFEQLLPRLRVLVCSESINRLEYLLYPSHPPFQQSLMQPDCPSRLSRASSSYQDFHPPAQSSPPASPSPLCFYPSSSPYQGFHVDYEWSQLQRLICTQNGIERMDESLRHLPHLEVLDLSSNEIERLECLEECEQMRELDMGKNQLTSLEPLKGWSLRYLVKLMLPYNELVSLDGVQELFALTELDVRLNILSDFNQVRHLGGLSDLVHLRVQGNPLCHLRNHRRSIFLNLVGLQNKLQIDGKGMTARERQSLRTRKRHILLLGPRRQQESSQDNFSFDQGLSPQLGGSMGQGLGLQVAHISSPDSDSDAGPDGTHVNYQLERSATCEQRLPLLQHDGLGRPWSSFSFRADGLADSRQYAAEVAVSEESSEATLRLEPQQQTPRNMQEDKASYTPRSIPDYPTHPNQHRVHFVGHKVSQSADLQNALNEFFGPTGEPNQIFNEG